MEIHRFQVWLQDEAKSEINKGDMNAGGVLSGAVLSKLDAEDFEIELIRFLDKVMPDSSVKYLFVNNTKANF